MSVYIPVELRRSVRKHFGNCCAYCQTREELSAAIFEIEHINPCSSGGATSFENLCLSCPTCNRYKADRVSAVDPHSQEIVPLYRPHSDVWSDHLAWTADHTELVGLSAIGRASIVALRMNRPQIVAVRGMWVTFGQHPPTDTHS